MEQLGLVGGFGWLGGLLPSSEKKHPELSAVVLFFCGNEKQKHRRGTQIEGLIKVLKVL